MVMYGRREVGYYCFLLLVVLATGTVCAEQQWWQRGADTWYYKDDWKGLKMTGASPLTLMVRVPSGAAGGWIVIWGEGNCRLFVNDVLVDRDLDPCLIWDYKLDRFLETSPPTVNLRIEARAACAEGQIIGQDGRRYPFATGSEWKDGKGNTPRTEKMAVASSSGAFDRAHNGRLLEYNDQERGKTSIAKCLARIQKLNEQSMFFMKRFRPAEEIVSFEPNSPWRQAEHIAQPLADQAKLIVNSRAIPAQRAGRFQEAIAAAQAAETVIAAAEAPVIAAISVYKAHRQITHVENWAAMLGVEQTTFKEDLAELRCRIHAAQRAYGLRDWAAVDGDIDRLRDLSRDIRHRLLNAASDRLGRIIGGLGELDEFPEDRFCWLNARDLIGNDPSRWPFVIAPSSRPYLDLMGWWDFRLDPDNAGEKQGWYGSGPESGWTKIYAPKPWERQGYCNDNLNCPGDAPYRVARTGDKPYNGYAWYRKSVFVPAYWQGKQLVLSMGKVRNWYRIFVNGEPIGDGVRANEDRRLRPDDKVIIPSDMIEYGRQNLFVIQIYNDDNFGGIIGGRPALFLDGQQPALTETPGPMSYAYEYVYPDGEDMTQYAFLAGAMSPAVIVACSQPSLELWGWEAKGYDLPCSVQFPTASGLQKTKLDQAKAVTTNAELSERWILVQGQGTNALIVFQQKPHSIRWEKNRQGCMSLVLDLADRPSRAVILCLPADVAIDEKQCRFWVGALQKYPVSASECVWRGNEDENGLQRCLLRYNYLNLAGDTNSKAITTAPVPMLASFAMEHGFPSLSIPHASRTEYLSQYAPYQLKENSDTLTYQVPLLDRSRVMKGVGELFARSKAERNVHGGLGEKEMFRRMAEWGFDHCRYALAFDASWDLPLVSFRGGPISEDEALWKRLDELIANCNAAGVQMMLCSFTEIRSRDWKAHPERQRTIFEFWRRIAERYAHLPAWAISYDFFNEPAYMNTDHYKEIMKELTMIVRSVDKKHMIVWEPGDGWAQPQWCLWMEPVDDSNVLYSFHHYGKHWGYAYDEYYPGYQATFERTQADIWLEAILFGIEHNVPIHCGEFGLSMIQPGTDGQTWLNDYLALFERFGIGWNWWNYDGGNIYRTGLAAGDRISPYVPTLRKWMDRSGWGKSRGIRQPGGDRTSPGDGQ
jgi:aryl-phospho-beta-D-glucosidase BglC (GH1 family)